MDGHFQGSNAATGVGCGRDADGLFSSRRVHHLAVRAVATVAENTMLGHYVRLNDHQSESTTISHRRDGVIITASWGSRPGVGDIETH